jgi:hypothetical protein
MRRMVNWKRDGSGCQELEPSSGPGAVRRTTVLWGQPVRCNACDGNAAIAPKLLVSSPVSHEPWKTEAWEG